ncbi:MAG: type II toxin-antitoxin system VapC family toxin [Methanobrevibacter sp.]|nr:type II toxin-antitoxin system VapC family toxin [Methanobrevibacter sp.]
MTGYNKVFVDTTPIIYFLDQDPNFGDKAKAIFTEILSTGKQIFTSTVTCTEYLVYPYRTGNQEKIDVFFEFVQNEEIPLVPLTVNVAERAAKIRALYAGFKAMDAVQLATAVETGCDIFLTNDKQLKQFREVTCVTVEEWNLGL